MTNIEWIEAAKEESHRLVMTVDWPWTERQKRLWYIGILADHFTRAQLEAADIDQLQIWHKRVIH